MKILHTMDTGGIYGKERMLLALIKQQISDGHRVHVAGFGAIEFFEKLAALVTCVNRYESIQEFWCRLTTNNTYDVIHTHDYKTGIITSVWHMLNRDRVVIRTLHGYTGRDKSVFSKIWLYETLDKLLLRTNDVTVGVSDEIAEMHRARVVYNGVEPFDLFGINYMKPRQEVIDFCQRGVNMHEKGFVFCCMARLSPEKNIDMLIDAIFEIDKAKLLVFGDGPLREELEKKTSWNPDKFFFAGYDENAKEYLPFVDAYIQPSLYEGLPISVLEAMSANVPLIVSKVGGMAPLIYAGAAAECRKGNYALMASSLLSFMSKHEQRQHMAKDALTLFKNRFSAEVMYRQYNAIYLSQTMSKEAESCVE